MTALKPTEWRHARGVASYKYPLAEVSSHPTSTETADDAHHIFPRSMIGNASWFVEITPESGETKIIPHVVGLTREEHRRVENHESWIRLEDGVFNWYDRIPPTDPQDELPEEWQEWTLVGPLNPQPGEQAKPKRKRLKGEQRRKRKTISIRVPDDAEDGGAVWDETLGRVKERLVAMELYEPNAAIPVYEATIAAWNDWLNSC